MPELPEVEIMSRNVRRWVANARLVGVTVHDNRLWPAELPEVLGQRVVDVQRRAKYMLLELETGTMAWHFRMTGKFVNGNDERKARAELRFDNGATLRFLDTRRFGTLEWIEAGARASWETSHELGPEPWPVRRDGPWWSAAMSGARGPLKVAMLDQRRVAGVGNIAASEILWRAGISPEARASTLGAAAWARVADHAHAFFDESVLVDASDEIAYVNEGGENRFSVYGRADDPCSRCGAMIVRSVQAGRSTFACSQCQLDGVLT
jgi:formamidopyrimidine-DNA glycosylase